MVRQDELRDNLPVSCADTLEDCHEQSRQRGKREEGGVPEGWRWEGGVPKARASIRGREAIGLYLVLML